MSCWGVLLQLRWGSELVVRWSCVSQMGTAPPLLYNKTHTTNCEMLYTWAVGDLTLCPSMCLAPVHSCCVYTFSTCCHILYLFLRFFLRCRNGQVHRHRFKCALFCGPRSVLPTSELHRQHWRLCRCVSVCQELPVRLCCFSAAAVSRINIVAVAWPSLRRLCTNNNIIPPLCYYYTTRQVPSTPALLTSMP